MIGIYKAIEAAGGPARVAELLGVTTQAVCFWRDGKREMPVKHLAQLEAATGGVVRRWHMRPDDWHLVWPELVGIDGAPDAPAVETRDAA